MTLREIYAKAKANGQTDLCRFMRDMKRAGLRMTPYNGRCWWHGPAVSADSVGDVMSCTRIKCQHDSLGRGVIVYPRESLRGVERV